MAFHAAFAWALARQPRIAGMPFLRQAGVILGIILALGGAIELIQPIFGRTASLRDLGVNLLGGLVGLVFLSRSYPRLSFPNRRIIESTNQPSSDFPNQRITESTNQRSSDLPNQRFNELTNQPSSSFPIHRIHESTNQPSSDLPNQRIPESTNHPSSDFPNQRLHESTNKRLLLTLQPLVLIMVALVLTPRAIDFWDMCQASRQFPLLGDFETRFEARRWSSGTIDTSIARQGNASLRVELKAGQQYPGTTLKRSIGNWQGYLFLELSIHNPGPYPVRMTISIRDKEHFDRGGEYKDRFNQSFFIQQGWNDLRIPIGAIENAPAERKLDLSGLTEVVVFTTGPADAKVVHFDRVRLTK
jgi:hypothetical protein